MDLLPAIPLFPALTHLGVAIDDPRERLLSLLEQCPRLQLLLVKFTKESEYVHEGPDAYTGAQALTLTTCGSSSDGAVTTGQIGKLVQREVLIYEPKEMNLLPVNELARLKVLCLTHRHFQMSKIFVLATRYWL
jgi:hypothetical protein